MQDIRYIQMPQSMIPFLTGKRLTEEAQLNVYFAMTNAALIPRGNLRNGRAYQDLVNILILANKATTLDQMRELTEQINPVSIVLGSLYAFPLIPSAESLVIMEPMRLKPRFMPGGGISLPRHDFRSPYAMEAISDFQFVVLRWPEMFAKYFFEVEPVFWRRDGGQVVVTLDSNIPHQTSMSITDYMFTGASSNVLQAVNNLRNAPTNHLHSSLSSLELNMKGLIINCSSSEDSGSDFDESKEDSESDLDESKEIHQPQLTTATAPLSVSKQLFPQPSASKDPFDAIRDRIINGYMQLPISV